MASFRERILGPVRRVAGATGRSPAAEGPAPDPIAADQWLPGPPPGDQSTPPVAPELWRPPGDPPPPTGAAAAAWLPPGLGRDAPPATTPRPGWAPPDSPPAAVKQDGAGASRWAPPAPDAREAAAQAPGPATAAGTLNGAAEFEVPAGPPAVSGRRKRSPALWLWLTTVAAAAIVAAILASSGPTSTSRRSGAQTGVASGPPAATPGLRTPFVVHGVRLAVFYHPDSPWTRFQVRSLPAGEQWAFVALFARNLARRTFDPYQLGYGVLDAGGHLHHADRTIGSGGLLGGRRPLARGELVVVKLAFVVPQSATGLALRIDQFGRGAPIGVPLN